MPTAGVEPAAIEAVTLAPTAVIALATAIQASPWSSDHYGGTLATSAATALGAAPAPAPSAAAPAPAPVVTVPPAITSVNPTSLVRSTSTQAVTINGSGFKAGLKIVLTAGGTSTTIQGTAITSVATGKVVAQVSPGNTARVYSVQVINSDGKTSNTGSLTVK